MHRSHKCDELRKKDIEKKVTLAGWIRAKRNHGGIVFCQLADRYGLTQLVFSPEFTKSFDSLDIGREYVIKIEGKVRKRVEGTKENIKTGDIEVEVYEYKIINKSKVPPFEITEEKERYLPEEEIRLKYRYLDLRRKEMIKNIEIRSKIIEKANKFFFDKDFKYIQTPNLIKPTPEGAKDFLVPSRMKKRGFYALPQSPQLLKQLLMIGSQDKYFQIAKCFRDEDLRSDRQPEFTQIDMEMSFVEEKDIKKLITELLKEVMDEFDKEYEFKRLDYDEAIENYGTDSPDLRYEMKINDVTDIFKDTSYNIFKRVIENKQRIKAIKCPKLMKKGFDNKRANQLIKFAQKNGALGLTWLYVDKDSEINSIPETIIKSYSKKEKEELKTKLNAKEDDVILFIADDNLKALNIAGKVREETHNEFYEKPKKDVFVWVENPPLFVIEEGELKFMHHPFTQPKEPQKLKDFNPLKDKIYSKGYDIVLNGWEIGGGSIRIHKKEIQKKIFEILGYNDEEIQKRFGFFMEALKYGAPPHGGIAIGLDRLSAMIANKNSIKEVIAFPKNKKMQGLFDGTPIEIDEDILKEYNLKYDDIEDIDEVEDLLDEF
ncbi:MAG: aspartate--tRNA ligase [Candidatus Woesearchaeota archaeon]